MASENTIEWIESNIDYIDGSILEVGSKKYNDLEHLGLRAFLSEKGVGNRFLGCDLEAGENVDVQVDLSVDYKEVSKAFDAESFDTIFCVSVLEHIPNVFQAAENLTSLLRRGGHIFISVPFVFRNHGYPSDYWRFTPNAIKFLFPKIDFLDFKRCTLSTLEFDNVLKLSKGRHEKINRFIFRPNDPQAIAERKAKKAAGESAGEYSLAPCMINMLGVKVEN